jgi:hypothetical protein
LPAPGAAAAGPAAVADADLSPSKDTNLQVLSQHAAAAVASESSTPIAAAAVCSDLPRSCWNLRSSGSYVHDPARAEQLKGQIVKEEAAQLPLLQVGMLCLIIASVVITNITGRRVGPTDTAGVGVFIWGGPLDTPATWHGC